MTARELLSNPVGAAAISATSLTRLLGGGERHVIQAVPVASDESAAGSTK
jgi:hypothetical protein